MSGIVGLVGVQGERPGPFLLQSLTERMAFRGPDARQTWVGDGIGLGHALLRTWSVPESAQPFSLDGKVWIVADARLDARADLLARLQHDGHCCSADAGDAELILRAYASWGQACLAHLLGDFCFAIWDGDRRSLFCARDQLGIKPLYYAESGRWLAFSNTLDCVVLHAETPAALNELSVADFLIFGSVRDPSATMFAQVRRLPPAHALTWCGGELAVRRYWTFPEDEEIQYHHSSDYEEHFTQLLQSAVKDRLGPGPVAIALSGGLDSTSIAAMACRAGCRDLRAFTEVYDKVVPHDERYYSQLTAESLGIPIEFVAGDNYVEAPYAPLPQARFSPPDDDLLAGFDADFCHRAASASRILLTGEGGDNVLFFTNSHFRRLLRARRVGRFLRDGVRYARAQRGLPPMGVRTFFRNRLGGTDRWLAYPDWLNPDLEGRLRLRERWREKSVRWPMAPHRARPEAVGLLLNPIWQNLLEGLDPGVTRICLQHVHPYLDLRLLRFLFSIPPIPWMCDKKLVRSAMRGLLPEAVRLRPKTPLSGNPWLIFMCRNPDAFSKVPLNLAAYVDMAKCQAFLNSPAALGPFSYQFSARLVVLSAWLNGVSPAQRNSVCNHRQLYTPR